MGGLLGKHPELVGLGEEAQKVYLFLESEGESPASLICERTGVAYSRIHDVLNELQENGLILSRGESPKTFAVRFKDPALDQEKG